MHFKYDQNLELHNGIHAAIRGKLLEATFAPVWVEPLECSVMGGGFGEAGSTTAQTFALSGISGRNMKRPRLLMRAGRQTLQLSQLFNAYCRLHDDCVAFCNTANMVVGTYMRLQTDASYRDTMFQRDSPGRSAIGAAWPAYHKLRRDKQRLDDTVFADADVDTSLSDEEKDLSRKVKSTKASVHKLFLYADNNKVPVGAGRFAIDAFAEMYLVHNMLLASSSRGAKLEDPAQHLMMQCIRRGVAEASHSRAAPNAGLQRFFLDQDLFKEEHIPRGMAHWQAESFFAATVVSSMLFAQNCENAPRDWAAGDLVVFSNTDNNRLNAAGLFEALMEVSASDAFRGVKDPNNLRKMAVWLMPFLAMNRHIGHAFAPQMDFRGTHTLLSLARNSMGGLFRLFTTDAPPGDGGCLANPEFFTYITGNFQASFQFLLRREIEYGSLQTVVGSFLGGMFACSAYWKAHTDSSDTGVYAMIQPFRDNTTNCTVGSRICMMATSAFMVAAGVVMGTVVTDEEMKAANCQANMVTALFLVYLHLMMHMQAQCRDDMTTAGLPERRDKFNALLNSDPDLVMMCKLAWSAVNGFQGRTDDQVFAHIQAVYAPYEEQSLVSTAGVTGPYMGRKAGVRIQFFSSAELGGGIHTPSNLSVGSILIPHMHSVLCNKVDSENRVYRIIFEAIYGIDTRETTTIPDPGTGTNTRGAIPDYADADTVILGDEFSQQQEQRSAAEGREGQQETQTTPVPTNTTSNISLGSILLDRSEQVVTAAVAPLSEEVAEGEQNNSKDKPTTPEEPAEKTGGGSGKRRTGGGASGGGSSSSSFKKVNAKLL